MIYRGRAGTIYFTGTAGAGKTSLVRAFADWTKAAGYDAAVVNLDPGSEASEDAADVDIREWVRLADLQEEYQSRPERRPGGRGRHDRPQGLRGEAGG